MRKLLILSFFLPLMAWAQSSLPPCPETGVKNYCVGTIVASVRGSKYVGEFANNKASGFGVFLWPNGDRFVGEWREDKKEGLGVEYRADGSVIRSGQWAEGTLIRSFDLNAIAFPFAPNIGTVVPTSPSSSALSDRRGLQPCREKGVKDNCVGSDNFAGGARYVGEYRAGRRMGEGILYDAQGGVISSGRWQEAVNKFV